MHLSCKPHLRSPDRLTQTGLTIRLLAAISGRKLRALLTPFAETQGACAHAPKAGRDRRCDDADVFLAGAARGAERRRRLRDSPPAALLIPARVATAHDTAKGGEGDT